MVSLFNRRLPTIFSETSRAIQSNHPNNITKYIEFLHSYFTDHKVLQNSLKLSNAYKSKRFEALDHTITIEMLPAEHKCHISHCLHWSKEVNAFMVASQILKICLSSLKNSIDCFDQIKSTQNTLDTPVLLPIIIEETNFSLRHVITAC